MVTSFELGIIAVLKVLFAILGCYIVIKYINPKVKELMNSSIDNRQATEAFIDLLNIFIIIVTGLLALSFLSVIKSDIIEYIQSIRPVFLIGEALFEYIKWIILILLAILGLRYFKTKPKK